MCNCGERAVRVAEELGFKPGDFDTLSFETPRDRLDLSKLTLRTRHIRATLLMLLFKWTTRA